MVLKNLFTWQQWRNRCRKQTYGHGREEDSVRCMERVTWKTYITICKIDSQWEFSVWLRKLNKGSVGKLNKGGIGQEMGERFKREGISVFLWLIHVEVWQKTTKFCKAIIFQ